MSTRTFEGVFSALITPFTEDGSAVDHAALTAVVGRAVDAGVGGLVSPGSTGEVTALSGEERRAVLETVIEAAGGLPVIAGTSALTTAETVALSVHADRSGAAGVMVIPP